MAYYNKKFAVFKMVAQGGIMNSTTIKQVSRDCNTEEEALKHIADMVNQIETSLDPDRSLVSGQFIILPVYRFSESEKPGFDYLKGPLE